MLNMVKCQQTLLEYTSISSSGPRRVNSGSGLLCLWSKIAFAMPRWQCEISEPGMEERSERSEWIYSHIYSDARRPGQWPKVFAKELKLNVLDSKECKVVRIIQKKTDLFLCFKNFSDILSIFPDHPHLSQESSSPSGSSCVRAVFAGPA